MGTEAVIEFIRMHVRIVLQETTGLHMDHAGHNSRPTWARLPLLSFYLVLQLTYLSIFVNERRGVRTHRTYLKIKSSPLLKQSESNGRWWASESDRMATFLKKLCLTCDILQADSLQHQCRVWWLDEFQNVYCATT